jgi:MFS transporter, ACS family, glucarate transporter
VCGVISDMVTPMAPGLDPTQKPTRARYNVIIFALLLAVLSYVDRVCLSMAAPDVRRDLGLDTVQMGYVFSTFALAYALFGPTSGWLGDRFGPKRVLVFVVIWWSVCIAATGWTWNFVSIIVVQLFFGAGEAGCFPNLTKAITIWLPKSERVRAQGLMWMFARLGGAFAPPLMLMLISWITWRWAFSVFAVMGFVWAVFFMMYYREHPSKHPSVNAAELKLIGSTVTTGASVSVPWSQLAKSKTVWLIWAQWFLISYPFYFFLTWWPTYLIEGRHLAKEEAATWAVVPLIFSAVGSFSVGMFTPALARKVGSFKTARRLIGGVSMLAAGVLVIFHMKAEAILPAVLLMGCVAFFTDLTVPTAWSTCMDVGGKFTGTLSGSMNMFGNFGSLTAPIAMGYMVRSTGNWNYAIYSMVAAYILAGVCWVMLDAETPLEGAK